MAAAYGVLLGGVLGLPWLHLWPGGPGGSVALMMELTSHARSAIVPMLLIVSTATLVARTIEPRPIYDVRLGHADVARRKRQREATFAG